MADDSLPQDEIWKQVPGWPYEVSSHGKVRPLNWSRANSTRRPLTPEIDKNGYLMYNLMNWIDNKRTVKKLRAGRLVCEVFNGPPGHPSYKASPIDGNPQNLYYKNWKWSSESEVTGERIKKHHEMLRNAYEVSKKPDPVIREITYEERTAYFAGLLDGEAHIGFAKSYNGREAEEGARFPRITLEMTDEATVKACAAHFGVGSLKFSDRASRKHKHWKPLWGWSTSRLKARQVAELIRPYAITKASILDQILALPIRRRGSVGKFTDDEIREIRRRWLDGETGIQLGAEFEVHPAYISQIIRRLVYAHVDPEDQE